MKRGAPGLPFCFIDLNLLRCTIFGHEGFCHRNFLGSLTAVQQGQKNASLKVSSLMTDWLWRGKL